MEVALGGGTFVLRWFLLPSIPGSGPRSGLAGLENWLEAEA